VIITISANENQQDTAAILRQQVAQAGAVLHQQGLVDYLGHCSARIPGTDRVVIKPKHSTRTRSPQQLGGDDMSIINLDGELVEGSERPPAECFIHTEIYRARPDVHAVVHTHQPAATTLGLLDAELKPLLHVPAVLTDGANINTWPVSKLVTDPDLGRQLAAALGDAPLCHLQGHGIVSVAADLPRATVAAIALEQLARTNLDVLHTGLEPRQIPREEIDSLRQTLAPISGRWAYYCQLIGRSAETDPKESV
jgi:ribulose-5-phosphate 4-epimerase/fuculose-1-phosphate aldolase